MSFHLSLDDRDIDVNVSSTVLCLSDDEFQRNIDFTLLLSEPVSLGQLRDFEIDGQTSAKASGDGDDEDGIRMKTLIVGETVAVGAMIQAAVGNAFLDGWIDFDHNGVWDHPAEQVLTSVPVASGRTSLTFQIPATATAGDTFARFRLTAAGNTTPSGLAADGEVEDYRVILGESSFQQDVNDTLTLRINTTGETTTLEQEDESLALSLQNGNWSGDDQTGVTGSGSSRLVVSSSPTVALVQLIGREGQSFDFGDRNLWRMGTPIRDDGLFMRVIESRSGVTLQLAIDLPNPWQNLVSGSDINNDLTVSVLDALQIINELGRGSFTNLANGQLTDPGQVAEWPGLYYDQSEDGRLTTLDALRVINELGLINNSSGEAEAVDAALQAWSVTQNSSSASERWWDSGTIPGIGDLQFPTKLTHEAYRWSDRSTIPRDVLSEDAVSEREPMHPLDACLLDFLDA